jgi:hypothetical protein
MEQQERVRNGYARLTVVALCWSQQFWLVARIIGASRSD